MNENPIPANASQSTEPCAMRFCPSAGLSRCPLCGRFFCDEHLHAQEHVQGPYKERVK